MNWHLREKSLFAASYLATIAEGQWCFSVLGSILVDDKTFSVTLSGISSFSLTVFPVRLVDSVENTSFLLLLFLLVQVVLSSRRIGPEGFSFQLG